MEITINLMERSWTNVYICMLYISVCWILHIFRNATLDKMERSWADFIVIVLWPVIIPAMILLSSIISIFVFSNKGKKP